MMGGSDAVAMGCWKRLVEGRCMRGPIKHHTSGTARMPTAMATVGAKMRASNEALSPTASTQAVATTSTVHETAGKQNSIAFEA
eukprot:6178681-Pleurochrysis_carterae.AAC.2